MTRDQNIRAQLQQMFNGGRRMFVVLLESLPASIIVAIITWLILSKLEKKHEALRRKKKAATGLAFYITLLLQMGILLRPFGSEQGIKWVPFLTPGGSYLILLYSVANCIIFIPLGILLAITFRNTLNSVWKIAIVVFLFSLLVETIQYIFACGYSEVEDLIMNVVGGIIGYLCVKRLDRKRR